MRFLHNRFGGIVTPFETSMEPDPSKRTWETRTSWKKIPITAKINRHGKRLQKGEVSILPTQEVFNLVK